MVAAQIAKPGEEFEVVEREIPKPGAGDVLIKVMACGVCHSDVFAKEGLWPGIQYPRVTSPKAAASRKSRQLMFRSPAITFIL